jgi:hypothetical protein
MRLHYHVISIDITVHFIISPLTRLDSTRVYCDTIMRRVVASAFLLLTTTPLTQSFVVVTSSTTTRCSFLPRYMSDEDEPPKLVLDSQAIQEALKVEKSRFPTAESDYLAAARQRAAEARESVNSMSSDEDWFNMASQKTAEMGGTMDDWEASRAEAGNADSLILIPATPDMKEGEEPPEPKLLLF